MTDKEKKLTEALDYAKRIIAKWHEEGAPRGRYAAVNVCNRINVILGNPTKGSDNAK